MSHAAPPRKTKIVATAGPACDDEETLVAMIRAGMNVVRINLSHGNHIEQGQRVQRIRAAAESAEAHVAIMVDTKGIEVRTGLLEAGPVDLTPGQAFTLYTDGRKGNLQGVSVSYRRLPSEVAVGATIMLDDGAIEMTITDVSANAVECRLVHGGRLNESKGVNLPDSTLSISAVSPEFLQTLENEIEFAVTNQVDYLAASFVQSGAEIEQIRKLLGKRNGAMPIIAKIENRAGVENLDDIVEAADGIMVARGDLGVELPLAEVPSTQKKLIRHTVMNGKPVITATQMLASMETNPKPTRAEASDVANAILDGSSAVMLSGETAVGKYPVEAVETMAVIALRAEASLGEYGYLQTIKITDAAKIAEAVAQFAARMAEQLQAAAIITLTETGFTARLISKHRPECPILAVTKSATVARRLALNWGVIPLLFDGVDTSGDESITAFGCSKALQLGYIDPDDIVVVTHGSRPGAGGTDIIQVVVVKA